MAMKNHVSAFVLHLHEMCPTWEFFIKKLSQFFTPCKALKGQALQESGHALLHLTGPLFI
jgi:hypothetical protein